jgi:hypothetical protein
MDSAGHDAGRAFTAWQRLVPLSAAVERGAVLAQAEGLVVSLGDYGWSLARLRLIEQMAFAPASGAVKCWCTGDRDDQRVEFGHFRTPPAIAKRPGLRGQHPVSAWAIQ